MSKYKKIRRYLKKNKWEVVYYVFIGLFSLLLFIYGFNKFKSYFLEKDIENTKSNIVLVQKEIVSQKENQEYQKYEMAKFLEGDNSGIYWNKTILELIKVFNDFKNIGNQNTHLVLDDFKIDFDKVKIKGNINNIDGIYADGGLLDKIIELEFIDKFVIPSYKKLQNSYGFTLDAKINIDDPSKRE